MPEFKIKGDVYAIRPTNGSAMRRAIQISNSILEMFRQVGISEDDVDMSEERMAMKKAPAFCSWWVDNTHCHFSFNKMNTYVDNLLVVSKVIEHNLSKVNEGTMQVEQFILEFRENDDVSDEREKAREFFGLDKDHTDIESINKQYKLLAKTLHPDMPTGDVVKFKELNKHHKILKRELE